MAPEREHSADPAGSGMPTEDAPEYGAFVTEGVAWPAARWIDDEGNHIVDSMEFDLRGVGGDWGEAFMSFGMAAFDLFEYITELIAEDRATDAEREVAALIGKKILGATERRVERLETELNKRPTVDAAVSGLLAALNLRRQQRTVVERQQDWDPDQQMRPSSRTPLPA